MKPKILYLYIIKDITNVKPIINEMTPALIESFPKSGPTVLSSIISNGAGKAPDLNNSAKSVAVWKVKFPVIWPEPPTIASLIVGALIILLSRIIANCFPTPAVVAFANFLEPTLSKLNTTTVSLVWLFILGFASVRFSPLIIILLLIISSLLSSPSYLIFSVPKVSSFFWDTNWNVKFAVLPNKFLILAGSSRPGNSTKILLLPLFTIFGSFVPSSSTLLLTISIAWSKDEFFKSTKP